MSKQCAICSTMKPTSEFYVIKGRIMNTCKSCHITRQSIRQRRISQSKPKGFDKLPEDKREYILSSLPLQVPKTVICRNAGITVPTLNKWIKNGQIEVSDE